MKEIKLKQLSISNFKGISKLDINFKDITTISGQNATGKSSIFDAFYSIKTVKEIANLS